MRIGRLDRRITIQRRELATDSFGADVGAWVDVVTTWAGYEPISGAEQFAADQRYAAQLVRFTIRHRAGIEARMRVVYDGQVWDIQDVAERGRRSALLLTCRVVNPASGPPGGAT